MYPATVTEGNPIAPAVEFKVIRKNITRHSTGLSNSQCEMNKYYCLSIFY